METSAFAVAPLVVLTLACHSDAARADPPVGPGGGGATTGAFHDTRAMAPGSLLRLSGVSGAIEATGIDDGVLDVRATLEGHDPSRMRVVVRQEAGGVAVCALYADEPAEACRLAGVARSTHWLGADSIELRIVARVPRGVRLVAETTNGPITATGLTGAVTATTLNGDVTVSTSRTATASTANGAIDAAFGEAPTGPLSFVTSNGRVRVRMPATLDADVEASTTNGQIVASFPMAVEALPYDVGPKRGRARLGRGGPSLLARTSNGSIDLRTGG